MKSLLSLLLLCLSFQVVAKEVAGIALPNSLSQDNQTYVLNGAGVRSKFLMDLYVGSLYLTATTDTADKVLAQDKAIIRLDILSDLITSDKMRDAISDGFEAATDGKMDDAMKASIAAFMTLFEADIKPGDNFVLIASRDGVEAIKNDIPQPKVGDATFAKALLNIWLGEHPAQKSLKRDMLGH
ncbi:chalcone isomerase family protein [Shewanella litorisediminis]|uniref:Chalcone isomerase family protein n=1 Tax=Shewanella litorisediminis TaxID=1173586 RepID=A0ABX7FZX2_9GAMM|nr:chalcone isomerase family protein [Shewanella litorisediminis]MCL2918337.1 chalcone isomerase family protein [Shewanella litorisediminis]QRH00616.1 chalcone isomerase family protein [Shewanella litorisediminis]